MTQPPRPTSLPPIDFKGVEKLAEERFRFSQSIPLSRSYFEHTIGVCDELTQQISHAEKLFKENIGRHFLIKILSPILGKRRVSQWFVQAANSQGITRLFAKIVLGADFEDATSVSSVKELRNEVRKTRTEWTEAFAEKYASFEEEKVDEARKELEQGNSHLRLHGFCVLSKLSTKRAEELNLEGARPDHALKHWWLYLWEMEALSRGHAAHKVLAPPLLEQITQLQRAEKWATEFCLATTLHRNGQEVESKKIFNKTVDSIQKEIQELKEGASIVIPGGTKNHAVLYKVTREGNTYSFEIYNTGEGAIKQGASHARSWKLTQCSLANMADIHFLRALFEEKIMAENMEEVFETIESFPIYKESQKVKGDRYPLQHRGSCSYACVLAYLKGSLPRPLFRLLEEQLVTDGVGGVAQHAAKIYEHDVVRELMFHATNREEEFLKQFRKRALKWERRAPEYAHLFRNILKTKP